MFKQAFFKRLLFFLPIFLFSIALFAQDKYWLEFDKEKLTTEQLSQELSGFDNDKLEIHYISKWNPIISISASEELIEKIRGFEFVKNVSLQRQLQLLNYAADTKIEYSYALEQIKAHFLTDSLKLSGRNVNIGIIDGGFMDADAEPSLKHTVENKQIIFFKDFLLEGNKDPFYGKRISGDDHGTEVLKMIAGSDNGTSIKYGMAENANLYLARTDHGIREKRIEEDYWVAAIELFYEKGIRLVNSSLGYTDGFDKRKENHKRKEVDGKSSMITKTAQLAAQKGMLIVSAAGNDGHNKWEVLSLPSDAKDIFAVGAVQFEDWSKIYYSSIGPEKLDYIKPDVVCFASNGTSFSAPVITGLAACIWEYDSTLTNLEVMDIIRESSHLSISPNNYLGYGVPDSEKIAKILKGDTFKNDSIPIIKVKRDNYKVEIPKGVNRVVIFHKENERNVISQESIKIEENQQKLIIKRNDNAAFTTAGAQNKWNIEIEWE